MKHLFAAAMVCLACTGPALADGKIYVQLPDLGSYKGANAEAFLAALVLANVVSSNCPDFAISGEEWSLLTDSADLIGYGDMHLTPAAFDERYYGPAFAALDQPDTCATEGPKVQPVIDRLVALGGSREALPDQNAAYEADQAMRAAWDAAATGKKTKTK